MRALARANRRMVRLQAQCASWQQVWEVASAVTRKWWQAERPRRAEPSEWPAVQTLAETLLGGMALPWEVRRAWFIAFPAGIRVWGPQGQPQGVLHWLPLPDAVLDALAAGTLAERDLLPSEVDPRATGAHVILLAAAHPQIGVALLLDLLAQLAAYRRVTAVAETPTGHDLCRRLGMQAGWSRGRATFFELKVAARAEKSTP